MSDELVTDSKSRHFIKSWVFFLLTLSEIIKWHLNTAPSGWGSDSSLLTSLLHRCRVSRSQDFSFSQASKQKSSTLIWTFYFPLWSEATARSRVTKVSRNANCGASGTSRDSAIFIVQKATQRFGHLQRRSVKRNQVIYLFVCLSVHSWDTSDSWRRFSTHSSPVSCLVIELVCDENCWTWI